MPAHAGRAPSRFPKRSACPRQSKWCESNRGGFPSRSTHVHTGIRVQRRSFSSIQATARRQSPWQFLHRPTPWPAVQPASTRKVARRDPLHARNGKKHQCSVRGDVRSCAPKWDGNRHFQTGHHASCRTSRFPFLRARRQYTSALRHYK